MSHGNKMTIDGLGGLMRRSLQKRKKGVQKVTKKVRAKGVLKAAKKVRAQTVQKAPSLQAPSQSENDTQRQTSFEDCYEVDADLILVRRSELTLNQGRRLNGEIVAVANHQKCLSAPDSGVPGGAIHEVALLKGMQHPNVVQLLDVFCDTSKTVVVLSHAGSSLAEYLKDGQRPLNENLTRSMCLQLLLGIEFCHSHGIMLCNLKPQNIFVDMSASTPDLRVAGFSSARLIPLEYRGGPMTITYLAPEILLGSMEGLCMEADMWSAGCVLGELVTGFPLFFAGHTEIGTLFRIFSQRGTPRETTWPGVTQLPDFSQHFPQWTGQAWSDSFRDKLGFGGTALLSDLLALDPRSRPSARRALQHPWFNCSGPCTAAEIDKFRLRFGSCLKACCRRPLGNFLRADVLSLVESFVGQSHAPQLAEYATDIYQLAREREEWSCPRADFWNVTAAATVTQQTVQEHGLKCRAILCDWMVEVCLKFGIPDSTLYLSVAIVDRYISKRKIERHRFQCLGVAAMLIAHKFWDENTVETQRWVYVSDRAFTLEDLTEMEVRILEVIQFKLTAPTVPYFLRRFLSVSDSSESHGHLAHFLAEITLLRVTDFPWPPSHIAAAAIALSNILHERTEPWPSAMEVRTGYALCGGSPEIPSCGCSGSRTPLDECVGKLRALLGHVESGTLQASVKKYAGKIPPIGVLAKQAACDGRAE